jgi:N-dimethylarginine dimethylaminohydrolase
VTAGVKASVDDRSLQRLSHKIRATSNYAYDDIWISRSWCAVNAKEGLMISHKNIKATEPFSLRRRSLTGKTKPLIHWGFRNETDVLTDVLLGSPAYLKHLATSSLSRKHLRESPANIQIAQAQHKELVAAYERFGVQIHWHEPAPELPMQVYARDSSVMTPYGAIITAMANWWRRGENYAAVHTYERLGIPIYDMVTAGTFEGGDFNVMEEGCVLIGCGGARTQEEGARQVEDWFRKEGWETRLAFFDEYYVHIDLMIMPVAPKLTAVCLACTEPGIVDWLRAKGHEIIDVPFEDTMALGCNFMALGKNRVIAPKASRTLIEQLQARGFEVAKVDMSEISKTGGGIHCMAQALRRAN